MIPAIALMIGAYIITRMVEILSNKENSTATAMFALITILVVLFCIFNVFTAANNIDIGFKSLNIQ